MAIVSDSQGDFVLGHWKINLPPEYICSMMIEASDSKNPLLAGWRNWITVGSLDRMNNRVANDHLEDCVRFTGR